MNCVKTVRRLSGVNAAHLIRNTLLLNYLQRMVITNFIDIEYCPG
jgi:hypothetical protein